MVVAYKWGGIAFDDYTVNKILILPLTAKDDTPITFHDEGGSDYQVPGGKVFIVGKISFTINANVNATLGRVGESDTADNPLTKEVLTGLGAKVEKITEYWEVLGVFTAGKYVTAESTATGVFDNLSRYTTLYGVEIEA